MEPKQMLKKIINTKLYMQQQLNLNQSKMRHMIDAINRTDINDDAFKIIRILIRYFRFPILILFRPFYERLEKQKMMLMNFMDDQMKIGSIVASILEDRQYPSLKFYFKAGFKQGIEQQLRNTGQSKFFEQSILDFDNKLHKIVGDKSKCQLDALKNTLNTLSLFKKQNQKLAPIFHLCLQAYEQYANTKKRQIQSLLQYRPNRRQQLRPKCETKRIYFEQAGLKREINDLRVSQDHLCCRPYFYYNEIIDEPQTITQQYKNYSYPYNRFLNQTLLKTIVGFLNGLGGIIYIGIRENNDTKKRLVKGEIYNESLKQDVLKHFRQLGQRISPEIVNNQLYKLEYVPVRDEAGFIPGQYLIRLKISKGQKDELYSFKNYDLQEYIAFRTANQVLIRRLGQEILELYRQKLSQFDEIEENNHIGPCKKPEIGRPLYENLKPNIQPQQRWINKKPLNPPQKNQAAYLFVGTSLIEDLKPYYHQEYKKIPVIQTRDQQSANLVQILIATSSCQDDYIPISLEITFEEQYFHQIHKTFSQKNILMRTQRSSRRMLIFSSIKQSVLGANILRNMGFPFQFTLPK